MSEQVSVREAARLGNVSTGSINYWIRQGWLVENGGQVDLREALEFAAQRREARAKPQSKRKPACVSNAPQMESGVSNGRELPHPAPGGGSPVEAPPVVRPPYQPDLPMEVHYGPPQWNREWETAPLVEQWLRELDGGGLAPNTLKNYSRIIRGFAGNAPDLPVERATIAAHLAYLDLKPVSVAQHFKVIRAFLLWARDVYYIAPPPLRRLIREPKQEAPAYYTEEQCRKVLAAAETKQERVIASLLLSTGMRASELASIVPESIGHESVRTWGKGGRVNAYPISPALRADLLELAGDCPTPRSPLFMGPQKPMDRKLLYHMISALVKRAGVAQHKKGPHVFRHTAAQLSLRHSGNLRYVQELLHHSSVKITQRYTYLDTKDIQEMHEQWDPLQLIEDGKEAS